MIMFVALAAAIAIFYQNILALGFSLASLNIMLFPVVFGTLYWTLKQRAVFWSLLLGFLSVVVLFATNALSPETAVISLPVVLFSLLALEWLWRKRERVPSHVV